VWSAAGPTASAFLEQILPYLRVKNKVAALGIEFQKTKGEGARVTQQDIANKLGLGNSTVNACIKGTYRGADSTKELVLKTADEMGFVHKGLETPPEILARRDELMNEIRELNARGQVSP
jgi:hypothetical protein